MRQILELLEKITDLVGDENIVINKNDEFDALKALYGVGDFAEKQYIINKIEELILNTTVFKAVYLYTFLINITSDCRYVVEIIDMAMDCEYIKLETKYFIYNQIKSMGFLGKYGNDISCKAKIQRYFEYIINEYRKKITQSLVEIPGTEKNNNLAIVITEQFLSDKHGPTKSALGRCIALKKMGKEVMLINTAELMSVNGGFPTFEAKIGSYAEFFTEYDTVEWKGEVIPFFQCDNNMPDLETINYLLGVIRELKPGCVVSIGGEGIFVSLVNDMLPVLAVSMVPSMISTTVCAFQTLGRALNDDDKKYLKLINRDENRIIEHKFTSDLIEQSEKKSKLDLGISDDSFVVAVAGARLDIEVTDEFMNMMNNVIAKEKDVVFVILGRYSGEEKMKEKYPEMHNNVKFMGFVNDILSYYEACDLYVNPIRVGGGTSSVEALSKGVPVITVNHGDVAINVGADFFTADYASMEDDIIRYKNDKKYYEEQVKKAVSRAEVLLDTQKAFKELIEEFQERSRNTELSPWSESYVKKVYSAEYNLLEKSDCEKLREKRKGKIISDKPKISFMMTTYNDASLLNVAINSLLRQNNEDWELIIWDNSDKSNIPWKIIQNAMNADDRIKGYRDGNSYGWPKGAAMCMEHVKGEYTTFLASDDCLNINAIDNIIDILEEKKPDVLWVSAVATQYEAPDKVKATSTIINQYKEYDDESCSENIVNIMKTVYYNSFYHYMKVEFLRENNIDFFEPYYADCGGMTKALANAKTMITSSDVVYYLTGNTSQTKGRYTWDSVMFEYGIQWESVKETFAKENYSHKDNISYVAKRILNNIIANVRNLIKGNCRDKYMNPIVKNNEEILQQLEAVLEERNVQEMIVFAGRDFANMFFEAIETYICDNEDSLEDKTILKNICNIVKSSRIGDISADVKAIVEFVLCRENKVFMGFEYFAQLLERCPDEIVANNERDIQLIIENYTAFLEGTDMTTAEKWYVSCI